MAAKIKICGVTHLDHIDALNANNVELVGFNFYKPSSRYVTQNIAAQLAGRCHPSMERVALLVDPTDDEVDEALAAISPHRVQLHGTETPQRVAEIKARSYCAIIKALPVSKPDDVQLAQQYDAADWFLFDAKPHEIAGETLPGGNGLAFDWKLLADYDQDKPYLLAGGLNISNVEAALKLTGAAMVDIASGVESAPGQKDRQLIDAFVAAVRGS